MGSTTKKNNSNTLEKSTFLLKTENTISYILGSGLFKSVDGKILKNPFTDINSVSHYVKISLPETKENSISVYKSGLQPNTFLIIPAEYQITRDIETKEPCITTILHTHQDDSGLEDISKIQFQFAIGPKLSDFEVAKLKIALYNNNFTDNDIENFIAGIHFLYPNDLNIDYSISGDHFIQSAEVTVDGKYFIFNITTEHLSEASLFINSLNNQMSRYANISFDYKDIKSISLIDLNLETTIGESIVSEIDNLRKRIILKNHSLSPCKLSDMLLVYETNEVFYNDSFFKNLPYLQPAITLKLWHNLLNSKSKNLKIKNVFVNHESIENFDKEFEDIRDSSTSYMKYITINIQNPQKENVNKISIELIIDETGNNHKIMKLREDFSKPILFNFIPKISKVVDSKISYKVIYFDSSENVIDSFVEEIDYTDRSIIKIY